MKFSTKAILALAAIFGLGGTAAVFNALDMKKPADMATEKTQQLTAEFKADAVKADAAVTMPISPSGQ